MSLKDFNKSFILKCQHLHYGINSLLVNCVNMMQNFRCKLINVQGRSQFYGFVCLFFVLLFFVFLFFNSLTGYTSMNVRKLPRVNALQMLELTSICSLLRKITLLEHVLIKKCLPLVLFLALTVSLVMLPFSIQNE